MSVADELNKQGYELEHEYGDHEGHTEVWINRKKAMAVKVQRMRVQEVQDPGDRQAARIRT